MPCTLQVSKVAYGSRARTEAAVVVVVVVVVGGGGAMKLCCAT